MNGAVADRSTNTEQLFNDTEPQAFYIIIRSSRIRVGRGSPSDAESVFLTGSVPNANLLAQLREAR